MPSRVWSACASCLSRNWSRRPITIFADARYKRVVATIDAAKFAVKEAEVAVDNTRIIAPFDGTVLKKNADVGEIVAPLAGAASSKAAVVTIADMSSLEVDADVSEANITRVTPEQDLRNHLGRLSAAALSRIRDQDRARPPTAPRRR